MKQETKDKLIVAGGRTLMFVLLVVVNALILKITTPAPMWYVITVGIGISVVLVAIHKWMPYLLDAYQCSRNRIEHAKYKEKT